MSGSINVIVDELKKTMTLIGNRILSTIMNQVMVLSITIMIFFYITYNELHPFEYNANDIYTSLYNYKFETVDEEVLKFRQDFRNFDDLDIISSFMYVFKSSYLLCKNYIEKINFVVYGIISFNPSKYVPHAGVLIAYILLNICISLNTMSFSSMVKSILKLAGVKSGRYIFDIIYNLLSSFIFMFTLYFIISSVVYLWYLLWGFISITSENASNILRFFYIAAFMIPILLILNLSLYREGIDLPQCNSNYSMTGYLMFVFIIPFLVSLEKIILLAGIGIGGITKFFTGFSTSDDKQSIFNCILGYGLLLLLIFTVWPLVMYMLIPNILSALNAKAPLDLYNSLIR